ncbi:hypothetical protein CB1_001005005 [Camelus ferus]|nr:hypothetical protein CB1_001005005 [Camelus ferus]
MPNRLPSARGTLSASHPQPQLGSTGPAAPTCGMTGPLGLGFLKRKWDGAELSGALVFSSVSGMEQSSVGVFTPWAWVHPVPKARAFPQK